MGRGPGYGLPAFVTWRFGSGVTVTSILFICPDITHVCVCVWSAVITVYATCRIPEAWGGGMRAFVHLWAAFQNSFISIISPPALRVSWHICRDYTPRFLALVSSKTPGFFLLCVEGEAWGSVGSASSIWISQRHFSKCAGKTYAGSYFPRVGNIAKSTLFHSFLCSIWFRIRVCFSSCEDLWGQGRQSFIRLTFLQIWEHPPPPQMLISLGDVGCQSRELAAWILPWLSLQPYIHSQAEPDWSSCEYHSAHKRKKKGIFTSMLNTRTWGWSYQVCFVLMLWELAVSLVNSFRM